MRISKRLVESLASLSLLLLPLGATTIISTVGVNGGFSEGGSGFSAEASWSQNGAFSNVGIAAEIDPGGSTTTSHTFSGTAYLTTNIGPGATPADEIANTTFSVTGTEFNPVLTTLFTGLTLGPGTYYLVLSSAAGGPGGWEFGGLGITPVTAAGVSIVDLDQIGSGAAYPPANNFVPGQGVPISNIPPEFELTPLLYSVTGDAQGNTVPEPATFTFATVGIGAFALINRKRRQR